VPVVLGRTEDDVLNLDEGSPISEEVEDELADTAAEESEGGSDGQPLAAACRR
jgi:hypothetical protein